MAHLLLEGFVDVLLQRREAGDIGRILRQKRIEQRFAFSCGMEPPLDAKALDQAVDAKPGRNNADRAEKRGLFGIDFVAGQSEPIAARGGDILGKGEDRDRLLLGELADAAEQERRLHRRAARRVDRQRHTGEPRQRKGAVEGIGMAPQGQRGAPLPRPDDAVEAQYRDGRRRIAKPLDRQEFQKLARVHCRNMGIVPAAV